ncbi:MAG: DUF4194 domain-containing protein [Prosthecochloris sp.]|nr:DUF4194 domain-containing protein [Prosthecochloris sp.]
MSTFEHGPDGRSAAVNELSAVVIPLLKGVVYQEDHPVLWSRLLGSRAGVQEFVAVLGLEVMVDEAEGYAFLCSRGSGEEENGEEIPRLVSRRQLSYPVSLMLALLRKKLAEADAGGGDTRLILSRDEVVEMIRIFLPAGSNEVRLIDRVDSTLNKIAELGFVRRLRGQSHMIEVRRIIKAYVDAQWLSEFEERLDEYRRRDDQPGEGADE